MSHRMCSAHPEPRSVAAITAKFKIDVKAAYEHAETSNGVKSYNKSFFEHLKNLPSEIDSKPKVSVFLGGKNENANVKKSLREISNDVRKLDVKKFLASAESALLKFQLRVKEIEAMSEGTPLESLRELREKRKKEWKKSVTAFEANLKSANTRFSFLNECAMNNFNVCAAQVSELVSTTECTDDSQEQVDTLNSQMDFLKDAMKLISALKAQCQKLDVDNDDYLPCCPQDLFVGDPENEATPIIKDFIIRLTGVQKKWQNVQFKTEKAQGYLRAMDRRLISVNILTSSFLNMCDKLNGDFFKAAKNANPHILYNTSLDNLADCSTKIALAQEVVDHAHDALNKLVDLDTVFQPSGSGSSSSD
ncbi:hypothetical protein CAEBREN_02808 [Caenorhabditis brenneri]|uniref:Uncharacterized protein n=1 Tax=Caenorhabditis brenneri TaxID=135651 RepID=G0MQS5_CAEBE|nr:hypothetical protein CAEBREN_02808 [Caenorhabditis brenneri]